MTITLTGENDFARSVALSQLVGSFVDEHGDLSLERVDGEDAEFVRLQEALTSLPFLANKKMVVLTSPAKNKQFADAATTLLAELPETTELVIYEPKFDKRSSLYKLLKSSTDFREFGPLSDQALIGWLVDIAQQHGASLSQGSARYLVDRVGPNQQMLYNELQKLSLAGGEIDRTRIDQLTEPTPQSTIFQLLDAALTGKAARAIALYDEQRRMKVEPQQIIAMFAWQLHIMALLRTAGSRSPDQVAREARISPYVAGKSRSLVAGMTLGRLVQILDELLMIDRRSKRESIDLDDALRVFILNLTRQ